MNQGGDLSVSLPEKVDVAFRDEPEEERAEVRAAVEAATGPDPERAIAAANTLRRLSANWCAAKRERVCEALFEICDELRGASGVNDVVRGEATEIVATLGEGKLAFHELRELAAAAADLYEKAGADEERVAGARDIAAYYGAKHEATVRAVASPAPTTPSIQIVSLASNLDRDLCELVEEVAQYRAPAAFWSRIVEWLRPRVGFDAGYIATTRGSSNDCQGIVLEHDAEVLRGNIGAYLAEITPAELRAYMTRAQRADHVWDRQRRRRMRVFREVLDPTGATQVAVRASLRGGSLLGFNLERRGGLAFSTSELGVIDRLASIIHIGDVLSRSEVNGDAFELWAAEHELTAREKQVADYAVRGLQKGEIAEVLHLSVATVRHALERVFERAGVKTRGEMVYEALTTRPGRVDAAEADEMQSFYQSALRNAASEAVTAPRLVTIPKTTVVLAR